MFLRYVGRALLLLACVFSLSACLEDKFNADLGSENSPSGSVAVSGAGASASPSVALTLNSSEATEMAFFTDQTCSYESATWRPYSANASVNVTAVDGVHTVSVLFRNADHFPSPCYTTTFILDRTGPTAPANLALLPMDGVHDTPQFTFYPAVDQYSLILSHQARLVDDTTGTTAIDWATLTLDTPPNLYRLAAFTTLRGHSYHIEVRGVDILNNLGVTAKSSPFQSGPFVIVADTSVVASAIYQIHVGLDSPATRDTTITYSTMGGTAIAGLDYYPVSGTVVIPQGQSSATFPIDIRTFFMVGPQRYFNIHATADFAKASPDATIFVPDAAGGIANLPTPSSFQVEVAVGQNLACSRTNSQVHCWGESGDLGSGTALAQYYPYGYLVAGLSGNIRKLVVGGRSACVLMQTGQVYCWGNDANLGITSNSAQLKSFNAAVVDIAMNAFLLCVSDVTGAVFCIGDNTAGALGDGTRTNRSTPTLPVTGLEGNVAVPGNPNLAAKIAVGYVGACAILTNGDVWCWGEGDLGEIGQPVGSTIYSASKVTGLSNITDLSIQGNTTCAINSSHQLYCFGANINGQAALPLTVRSTATPTLIAGAGQVSKIATEAVASCAIQLSGTPECWGVNYNGQLGYPYYGTYVTPVTPPTWAGAALSIGVGASLTCAIDAGGAVYCNGIGAGQNGFPLLNSFSLVETRSLTKSMIHDVEATDQNICVQDPTSLFRCWSTNAFTNGQNDMFALAPTLVSNQAITAIASANGTQCAIFASGGLKCRGSNSNGQLGVGSTTDSSAFAPVVGLGATPTQVAVGFSSACALMPDGSVPCWGNLISGQRTTPQVNASVPTATKLVASSYLNNYCVISNLKEVWCWGFQASGAFGTTNLPPTATAVQTPGLSGIVDIDLSAQGGCALKNDGTMYCWGTNGNGRTSDPVSVDNTSPVQVPLTGVTSMATSNQMTCAVTGGSLYCWGSGYYRNQTRSVNSVPKLSTNIAGYVIKVVTAEDPEPSDVFSDVMCALIQMPNGDRDLKCQSFGNGFLDFGQLNPVPTQIQFAN